MSREKIDVVFLDFDGVLSTERSNFRDEIVNPDAISNFNALCLENDLKVVISSSWRKYDAFLIKEYLKAHPEINRYIILDDVYLGGELNSHLIQTTYSRGFNDSKYQEALNKLFEQ